MAHDRTHTSTYDRRIIMKYFTHAWRKARALYEARAEPENLRPLADIYWRGLLLSTLAAIVGVFLFGLWEFVAVVESLGASPEANKLTPQAILDRSYLEDVLGAYDERHTEYQAIQNAAVTTPDPSK